MLTSELTIWKPASKRRANGFTLIELLVVIAITTVLLLLLFGPLVTGFQLTARAQATTQAQDWARVAMEEISRELGSAAGVRDTSHQYLDMRMFSEPGGVASESQLFHSYNAYLDIIPPRGGVGATAVDPTVDRNTPTAKIGPASTSNQANVLQNADLVFPLAPGTTIVRYFIGLRHPININYTPGTYDNTGGYTAGSAGAEQPYSNSGENQVLPASDGNFGTGGDKSETLAQGLSNTYILYRAEVNPNETLTASTVTDPTKVQYKFFQTNSTGTTAAPILDDPDFFRIYSPSDIVTLGITTAQAQQHNDRVYYWYQVAKPVIDQSALNLVILPHDGRGNVVYDSTSGFPAGSQLDTDGTPILRTSVTFGPATISNEPLTATNISDVSQGYGSQPSDNGITSSGLGESYVPALYEAAFGQWHGGPNITFANTTPSPAITLHTYLYTKTSSTLAAKNYGDLIETDGSGNDVYNVTRNWLLQPTASISNTNPFVAMSADGDSGTINFAIPAIPDGPKNDLPSNIPPVYERVDNHLNDANQLSASNPYWYMTFSSANYSTDPTSSTYASTYHDVEIHLRDYSDFAQSIPISPDPELIQNSPLSSTSLAASSSAFPTGAYQFAYVPNSRVAVNSDRVFGPDQIPGPGRDAGTSTVTGVPANYPLVPYRRVALNLGGTIGPNQYMIDYDHGVIYLGDPQTNINTSYGNPFEADGTTTNPNYDPRKATVVFSFSYQNNLYQAFPNGTITALGQPYPDVVKATYQTGSQIEVQVGIRVYDPSNNQPTYFNLVNRVGVGNASR